jgi:hypothetical protein
MSTRLVAFVEQQHQRHSNQEKEEDLDFFTKIHDVRSLKTVAKCRVV